MARSMRTIHYLILALSILATLGILRIGGYLPAADYSGSFKVWLCFILLQAAPGHAVATPLNGPREQAREKACSQRYLACKQSGYACQSDHGFQGIRCSDHLHPDVFPDTYHA